MVNLGITTVSCILHYVNIDTQLATGEIEERERGDAGR